jgi:hypothetical protein
MSSSTLRKLLQVIAVSFVPPASSAACASENCSGEDVLQPVFLTVERDGTVVDVSTQAPAVADGGAMQSADGGADAGAADCESICAARYPRPKCGGATVVGCATVGHAEGRSFVRCDLQNHRVCLPSGEVC